MKSVFKFTCASLALGLMAACGGGSTGTASNGGAVANSFDSLARQGDAIFDRRKSLVEGEEYTELDQLPTSGSARYSGIAGYVTDPASEFDLDTFTQTDIVSDIAMTVTFSDGSIRGTASNFAVKSGDETLTGALGISAQLDRTTNIQDDFSINGALSGTLQSSETGEVRVRSSLFADIYGTKREVLAGGVEGTATTSQGSSVVVGGFLLEKQ